MKRKIGILCASDEELAPFLSMMKEHGIKETKKAMLTFCEGKIKGADAIALYSGVCKVNSAVAAELLIEKFGTEAVISAGTAGGMSENIRIFDTVIAEKCVYHDVAEDILTEYHPWLSENAFFADAELIASAREVAKTSKNPIFFGTTVTGEQFITDDGREEINRKFAPLSVDMESTAAAHVCYVNDIPFLSVRTVTDDVFHRGAGNFHINCKKASEISAEICAEIIEKYCAEK